MFKVNNKGIFWTWSRQTLFNDAKSELYRKSEKLKIATLNVSLHPSQHLFVQGQQ